ncbi:MAG: ComF family protein [Betaproteobacteria bacterium]|nr:ComF family protein [Betaproteobacteria bacterium]
MSLALSTLPQQCEVCRRWSDCALCADCVARYAAPRPRCACCGITLGLPAPRCGDCLRDPPPFEHTVCVADYGFPWDALIGAFKFRGRAELAGLLAARLVAAVQAAAWPLPALVLPVPLSPQRLAQRGFNQAWEVARRAAATLKLPAEASLLQRPLETAHQAELGRSERQRNLRTAFMVDPRRRAMLQGARVALVDDVMTTGATAREASGVLLRAGAAAVDLWVLARTPDRS